MKIVVVIQARMGSSRLPGKVLAPICGRPILGWVVRAAQASSGIDDVVVATSTRSGDDGVAQFAHGLGVGVVRGSEDDVLSRYCVAIDETHADAVVRLTADNPFVDPSVISLLTAMWREQPSLDYVSADMNHTLPVGVGAELASAAALRRANTEATGFHRIHVTSYLYSGEHEFSRVGLVFSPPAGDLRVTVDTPEDLEMARALAKVVGDSPPAWRTIARALTGNPDIAQINQDVKQKNLAEG